MFPGRTVPGPCSAGSESSLAPYPTRSHTHSLQAPVFLLPSGFLEPRLGPPWASPASPGLGLAHWSGSSAGKPSPPSSTGQTPSLPFVQQEDGCIISLTYSHVSKPKLLAYYMSFCKKV